MLPPLTIVPATLLSLTLQAPAATAPASPTPSFTGTWQLNHQLSENPADKFREAMGARGDWRPDGPGGDGTGRPGAGGGAPGAGGGRPGGGWGGGRPGEEGGDLREHMEQRERAAERLTIDHQEPRLAVTDGNGDRWQVTVGAPPQRLADHDRQIDVQATWTGNRLTISRTSERGRTSTETWELVAAGKRILVGVELGGGGPRPKISFTRVYDLVDAPAAEAGTP